MFGILTNHRFETMRTLTFHQFVSQIGIGIFRLRRPFHGSHDEETTFILPWPDGPALALRVGLEPTTYRLTAGCSTIELPKHILFSSITRLAF